MEPDASFSLTDLQAGEPPAERDGSRGDSAEDFLSLDDVSLHVRGEEGDAKDVSPYVDAAGTYPRVLVIEDDE